MLKYDYVIGGYGFQVMVTAERLHRKGKKILIIERRDHIGCNCYSYEYRATNIETHKYGTHIFETDSKIIWD